MPGPIATHRETRKYSAAAAKLWEVVGDAGAAVDLTVDEVDKAAGLRRATQPRSGGETGAPRGWEVRLRPLTDGSEGASVQVVIQDLLALDGGTKLPAAVQEFFDRLEELMRQRGLDTAPPIPAATPQRSLNPMVWVGAAFVVLAILAGLSFAGVFRPHLTPEEKASLPSPRLSSSKGQASNAPSINPPTEEKSMTDIANATGSVVKMQTSQGDLVLELFDKDAPITAGSFLLLVKSGYYDGVTFHRVEPNFVIQGGDPTGTGNGGPGFTIPDELKPSLKHTRGTLSMAKTALPDTGGSQFFIVTGPASHLDMKHSVFGKVLKGMDVVDKIQVGDKMEKVTVEKESPDAPVAEEAAKKARVPGNG